MSSPALRAPALMSDPGYRSLKQYLVESTGLAFYQDKDVDLAEKIAKRLSAIRQAGCVDYLNLLRAGPSGDIELDELINDLTIGETYFFRFEEHFQVLRETIVPGILRRNADRRQIRVWSAGCSFGAEPYSISLLLRREFGHLLTDWQVSIVGTDINRQSLARAREGLFGEWALRNMDPALKAASFERSGRGYRLRDPYREGVSFHYHNLVKHPYPSFSQDLESFDIILCRNVLIYFSRDVIGECVSKFWGALVEGGWLLAGHAEIDREIFRDFRAVSFPGAVMFERPAERGEAAPPGPPDWQPQAFVPAFSPVFSPPSSPLLLPASPPLADPAHRIERAPPPAPAAPSARIRELADRAQWAEAAEICRTLIDKDRLDPIGHFYQALILEQTGRAEEADRALNRAIYLDRGFVLAHYHRGLLLLKRGDPEGAVRAFRNVLDLLRALAPETVLAESDGLSAAALGELTRLQLQMLGRTRPDGI